MINISCTVQINTQRINNRLDHFREKLYPAIKQKIKSGSDTYTPYLSGDLMDSADPSAADETPYLIYDTDYAAYQYYANGGAPDHDFPHRSRAVHPQATMLWVEAYMNAGGKHDIETLCENAPRLLRF